jgi:formate hydrogenlyase subunit 3/multisubunit Na+/H+ antiporter MnhD subunit
MNDDEIDFADASGKAMAGLLLCNAIISALVLQGVVTHAQATGMVDAAKEAAAKIKPQEAAVIAVAALNGFGKTWKKIKN